MKRRRHDFSVSGSGDAGTQLHDAEVWGGFGNMFLDRKFNNPMCDGQSIKSYSGALGPSTTRITMLLAHHYGRVIINGNEVDEEVCDDCFFELNDTADEGPVNNDLYFAFNRSVRNGYLQADGYGVCSAKLSWVCNVAKP